MIHANLSCTRFISTSLSRNVRRSNLQRYLPHPSHRLVLNTTLRSHTMSPAAQGPALHKFIVFAPDVSDADGFQRRLAVRPKHLANAAELHKSGVIKVGGAMLSPESISSPSAEKKMVGSALILEADSLETAKKFIETDPYYVEGVWDKEKLVILPFMQAAFPA
ncbi:hypothetical protein AcV5_002267 [Taiwanofungus camphoratus]|nr:hypothetical protein AcV5_002267 [Antrodia cinnamomea]